MKTRLMRGLFLSLMIFVFSCNDPRTIVTDIVHPDGSVTRKIEMRTSENNFKVSEMQVPFDSSWSFSDSLEVSEKGDTTYVKRAVKLFESVEVMNSEYRNDSSYNRGIGRHAEFVKKFRWFNTEYRFTEAVDKKMKNGHPVADYLNSEELEFFYSPDFIKNVKKEGADSIRYRSLSDTIDKKTDRWFIENAASEWIGYFSELTRKSGDNEISFESLKKREKEIIRILVRSDEKFDSLWQAGAIQKELLGETKALTYKKEADSALTLTTDNLFVNFKDYTQQIIMPGKLIGTNGFHDSTQVILWPVKSDFFLTEPYLMWAESKSANTWAWVVTFGFLLFVLTGMVIRFLRK